MGWLKKILKKVEEDVSAFIFIASRQTFDRLNLTHCILKTAYKQ